jgi:Uma2 family endonuclease
MTPTTHTRRHLGPEDAGIALTHDEYERAEYAPGHRYELVAGRLSVSPVPDFRHDFVQSVLLQRFFTYAAARPERVKHVSARARVIMPGPTDVEPDVALYTEVPRDSLRAHWRELRPVIVVEVISPSDPAKDLVRNRALYATVPSIQEYWIVDPRDEPVTLLALVRGPTGWTERRVAPGEVYRSPTLPDLEVDLAALLR